MYNIIRTTKFKKDLKKIFKRDRNDFERTIMVLEVLKENGVEGIPAFMKPHKLKGNYNNNWECHIRPDLLIIWIQIESPSVINLIRVGSHSDIF